MSPDRTPEYELIEQRIQHERELREANAIQLNLALEKQAAEYERRLDELNHAHARALNDRESFVTKDVFDIHCREFQTWRLDIATSFAEHKGEEEKGRRVWAIVVTAITVTINIIALAIALIVIK